MRAMSCLLLCLPPSAAFADALATEVYVLDRASVQRLAEKAGGLDRITEAQLKDAALHHAIFTESLATSLQKASGLRLLVSRKGDKLIYAIVSVPESGKERLECAGSFAVKEEKAFRSLSDPKDEPYLVFARVGNFLKR